MDSDSSVKSNKSGVVIGCYESTTKDMGPTIDELTHLTQDETNNEPDASVHHTESSSQDNLVTPARKKTKTIDKYICRACGGNDDTCHEALLGEWLKQKTISLYEESDDPDNVTENDITSLFIKEYNDKLPFLCYYHHNHEFDCKTDYQLPLCIENGSLLQTYHLIQQQQLYSLLTEKRKYACSRKHMGGY